MFTFRSLPFLLGLVLHLNIVAATKTAAATGDWSNAATWSPSGVPTSSDDVVIGSGYTVTVDGDYTCASVTINNMAAVAGATDSELLVDNGHTLTVSGNCSLNTTVSGLSTGSASVQVHGTLTIGGNLSLNNTLLTVAGSNTLVVGSNTQYGSLVVSGDLSISNGLLTALGVSNLITLGHGEIDIDGDITMAAGALSLLSTNIVTANDDGSFNNKTKIFKYGGNLINTNDEGQLTITDGNGSSPYEFWYDGTSSQTVETDNITYKHLYIKNSAADVDLEASLTNSMVEGKLYIDTGAVLHLDAAGKNLDALSGATDKINILNYGTLKLSPSAYADGIPPSTVITAEANGYVEFHHPTLGVAEDIVQESIDYPIIRLTGPGTKQLGSTSLDIDDAAPRASKIWLEEGVFLVDAGKEITLNNSYGVKTIQLDSNTTMRIHGDFSTLDTYWDVHRDNTINYNSNSTQTLYKLTSDGTTREPYGILQLNRTSGSSVNRNLPGSDTIQVANRLEIEDEIELILNTGSYLQLLSNAQYTAYITEIASSASITYSSSPAGAFGVQKYLPLPYRAYRDIASPIQNTTLASWLDAGVNMRGFPGSSSPSAGRTTVHYYDETVLDDLDIGFQAATNTTNTIHTYDGSDFEISAWRILDGNNTDTTYAVTLEDVGEIFTGDQTYKLNFTFSDTGADSRNDHDGWNFLGNPYAAPLNWNAIYNDASNSTLRTNNYISSTMYIIGQIDRYWEDSGNPGFYGFYNAATETAYIHDSIIPAYQGFWVKAYHPSSSSEQYTLTVKENHKYNEENSVYYKSNSQPREITDLATQLIFSAGRTADRIFIQPFTGATVGRDAQLDVPKFGNARKSNHMVDFWGANKDILNLWVNAVDFNKTSNVVMPLALKSNRADTCQLLFRNVAAITEHHCIELLDTKTGDRQFIFDNQPLSVVVSDSITSRYALVFSKDLSVVMNTKDPLCQEDTGQIMVSGPKIFHSEVWNVFRNDSLYGQYTLDTSGFVVDALAGNYRLVNTLGFAACGNNAVYTTVSDAPEVRAQFSSSAELIAGKEIAFWPEQSGNDRYLWQVQGVEYTNPVLQLTVPHNEDSLHVRLETQVAQCTKEQTQSFVIQQTTDIDNLKNTLAPHYVVKNKYISWQEQVNTVRIFDLSGKKIDEITHTNTAPLHHGTYLYCFNQTCITIYANLGD